MPSERSVFDLKAVNPNVVVKIDTRTPTEVIQSIEDQGKIVAQSLADVAAAPKGKCRSQCIRVEMVHPMESTSGRFKPQTQTPVTAQARKKRKAKPKPRLLFIDTNIS